MATPIGTRRHRVTIERRVNNTSLDTRGQLSEEFKAVEKLVPCSIVQLSGDEGVLARQTFPTATHTVGMRWRDSMSTKDRLIFGTRTLNILSLDNIAESSREFEIIVGEEV